MFSVGRFARLAGVSAKLLRAYDELGIFRPAWVDPASRYRYYSPAQLPRVRRILALRDTGMRLAEIGRLVDGGDLREALERRRAELERERREIDRRLRTLDITVDRDGHAEGDRAPDVVVRPLAAESVATMAVTDDEDDGAAFYALEAHVRDLRRRAHRPPGALIPRADEPDLASSEIFVPITRPIDPVGRIGYRRLPPVRAATLLVEGSYARLGPARGALERWASSAGMTPTGPLRIRYLQFGAERELGVPTGYVVQRPSEYLTELQLPVA